MAVAKRTGSGHAATPQTLGIIPAVDAPSRRLAFLPEDLARWPHLPAFWPEHQAVTDAAELLALPEGRDPPPGATAMLLRYTDGPLRAPRFGARHAPVALLAGGATPAPGDIARARAAADFLARARIGGEPGLPDPGAAVLGRAPRGAVLLLDPCGPGPSALPAAIAAAKRAGLPLLLARDPAAPAAARPVLPLPPGATRLDARLSPWTLLDCAADLHGASDEMALLAAAAGVSVAGRHLDPVPGMAALIATSRCADPFLCRPWRFEQALEQLDAWRRAQAENRPVAVCLGMSWWKRERISALFAHAGGVPGFARRPEAALRRAVSAKARNGEVALAAWARAVPPGFRACCEAAGVTLLTVEDGFVRSRGLGARFLPGASYAVDEFGIYYDPARPSTLERLLATAEFPPALLARAKALREAIVARGVTKYNLVGTAPVLAPPPGRTVLLVPGQVEDDASVRLGGGAIQGNLALLQAVRAAHPGAWIVYKPHPDLEAGLRRNAVPLAALRAVTDRIVTGAPLTGLLGQVDAVHTLTSLSGFEALLRGVPVTTWGQPFYAGWGLTEDRNPVARRGRILPLDALVAATLILFPRTVDPLTGLPCPPEVILERLDEPAAWPLPRGGWYRGVEAALRRVLDRARGLA
jgi:capsular polysaccharide export protein